MATPKDTMWEIEPHTQAKHEILRRYLGAWIPILARYNPRIVYIDGFCGPGRYTGGELGSPIIALNEAINHGDQLTQKKVTFLFMDERHDRIKHLESELGSLAIPSNFAIQTITGEFEDAFRSLLNMLDKKGLQIAPTFAFIDPFGFKGLPFELVHRLLQNEKTEVFINIMADSINRFLDHPDPKIKRHIIDLFGTEEALEIASTSGDRIPTLRLLYQRQLNKCANFVRYFEMRNELNRTVYYLFFATNHPLGHLKMKEAFWKVDSTTGFCFSDATNPYQLVLFEQDETPNLAKTIQTQFAGNTLLVEDIRRFVEEKTAFLSSHMRGALRLLESNKDIRIRDLKADGKKRRKNTFPDNATVDFLVD